MARKLTQDKCAKEHGHEFGYGFDSGICSYCDMIHDCAKDWKFDFDECYFCEICHMACSDSLVREIEMENQDDYLRNRDYREAVLAWN